MTKLSEEDWLLVNGYHDGELPAPRRAAFEARLAREPALSEALERVRELSSGLGAMRPLLSPSPPAAAAPRRPWLRIAGGTALAASLALALLVGPWRDGDSLARTVHAAFVAQSFPVDEARLAQASELRQDGLPDLVAARLALVSTRDIATGTAAHYAGVNNCRLTFFDTDSPIALDASSDLRMAAWHNGQRYYAILAEGMDPDRFQAITTYLIETTRKKAEQRTRMALLEATREATSCSLSGPQPPPPSVGK